MDPYDMQERIHEILEQKIAMGAGYGGRLRNFPSGKRGDAASAINYFDFVKMWLNQNPGYSWQQAVQLASPEYHALGMGYGTKAGAKKAVRTKLRRKEIKNAPSLGQGIYAGQGLMDYGDYDFYEGGVKPRKKSKKLSKAQLHKVAVKRAMKNPFVQCIEQSHQSIPLAARQNYCKLNKACYRNLAAKRKGCK